MDAYSMDLRKRVIAAYDQGEGTQAELAKRFKLTERWIQKLFRQRRETGSIAPKPHRRGRKAKISGAKEERLKKAVAKTPDASLDELRDRCGVDGSRMCIFRALRRLRITRKKSPLLVRSSRIRKSNSSVKIGDRRPQASTRDGSNSWTKPMPKPR